MTATVSGMLAAEQLEHDHYQPGKWEALCLALARFTWQAPYGARDAIGAYRAAERKHPGDRQPLLGAPCFWGGGSAGHGHVANYAGNGLVWSNDVKRPGGVDLVALGSIERAWGLPYLGWTEDLNGADLPLQQHLVSYDERRMPSATGGSGLLGDDTWGPGDTSTACAAVNAFLHLGGATYTAATQRAVRAWQALANAGGSHLRTDGLVDTPTYHAMGRAAARKAASR